MSTNWFLINDNLNTNHELQFYAMANEFSNSKLCDSYDLTCFLVLEFGFAGSHYYPTYSS